MNGPCFGTSFYRKGSFEYFDRSCSVFPGNIPKHKRWRQPPALWLLLHDSGIGRTGSHTTAAPSHVSPKAAGEKKRPKVWSEPSRTTKRIMFRHKRFLVPLGCVWFSMSRFALLVAEAPVDISGTAWHLCLYCPGWGPFDDRLVCRTPQRSNCAAGSPMREPLLRRKRQKTPSNKPSRSTDIVYRFCLVYLKPSETFKAGCPWRPTLESRFVRPAFRWRIKRSFPGKPIKTRPESLAVKGSTRAKPEDFKKNTLGCKRQEVLYPTLFIEHNVEWAHFSAPLLCLYLLSYWVQTCLGLRIRLRFTRWYR